MRLRENLDEDDKLGLPAGAPHPEWDAALAAVLAAVRARKPVVVVGAPGTGKSLLLARLAAVLSAEGHLVAHLRHAGVTERRGADVLLVDEADKRPTEELTTLRESGGTCVLAGLPALLKAVQADDPAPEVIMLDRLAARDVGGFVRAVLQDGPAVDDEAIEAFAAASKGVPRDLHILAGLAAFGAELERAGRIGARHVRAAAAMRHGLDEADDELGKAAALCDLDQPPAAPAIVPQRDAAAVEAPARPKRRATRTAAAAAALALAAAVFEIVQPAPAPETAPPALLASAPAGPVEPPSPPSAAEPEPALAEPAPAPAPPAPAAVPPAMPSLAAPRVVLTYPSNDPAAARSAQGAADRLARLGWAVEHPQPRAPGAGGVTFFFAEDAAGAAAVADALGAARPASARKAQASPGTIEVALPVGP